MVRKVLSKKVKFQLTARPVKAEGTIRAKPCGWEKLGGVGTSRRWVRLQCGEEGG